MFHALGDYKHKHKNRMKFLIKSLGWERVAREVRPRARRGARRGRRAAAVRPGRHCPVDGPPDWMRPAAAVGRGHRRCAWSSGDVRGPGIHPAADAGARRRRGRLSGVGRDQPAPAEAARLRRRPSSPSRSAICRACSCACWATSRSPTATARRASRRRRTWCSAGSSARRRRRSTRAWRPPGLGLGDADTIADVTSCPGAESCKLAVTQSRGLGRLVEDHVRANPRLIALAPSLDVKVSGCPNGCGQHHIAAVGFQGSLRKVDGRPAPQYFVMVGGGVSPDGATFGRLVAKIPARRGPAAARAAGRALRGRTAGRTRRPAAFFTPRRYGARSRRSWPTSNRSRPRPPSPRTSSIWPRTTRSRPRRWTASARRNHGTPAPRPEPSHRVGRRARACRGRGRPTCRAGSAAVGGDRAPWHELLVLSTCHRLELYAATDDVAAARAQLADWLRRDHAAWAAAEGSWTSSTGADAALHLCRVAAGLDSLDHRRGGDCRPGPPGGRYRA